MKFNELGFSPETTATEAIVQGFLDSNFAYFNPGGFDLSIHYMSDRQCLKRMSLKRANTPSVYPTYDKKDDENGDFLTDEDANKMIYGTDLKKLQDATYIMYKTDNEDINPDVVSDRLDGVKTDRSLDDDSDSPYKPVRREDKTFEDIYLLKKKLKDDFHRLEYLNKELQDDLNYMIKLCDRAATFKNLAFSYPSDYRSIKDTDTVSTYSNYYRSLSGGWTPTTSHNNFSVAGVYSIYQNCKVMIKENKKRLCEISDLLNYTQYLDFLIKPESKVIVNTFLSLQLTKVTSHITKYEAVSKFIDTKLLIVTATQVKLETYDENIKTILVSFFAPNPAGSVNPYSVQKSLYESAREKVENDKQKAIDKLNKDLEKGLNALTATVARP
jgi:hypothetical protein